MRRMDAVEIGLVKNISLLHHDGRKWTPEGKPNTLPGALRKIFKEDLKKMKNLANQQREEPRASHIQAQKGNV